MAYADFDFYTQVYFGDVLTAENAPRWLDRASDEIDALTFHRLEEGFPEIESHAARVRKAVCAVAEALYFIEQQRLATAASMDAQGNCRGAVTSVSSGRESISYSQASNTSMYAKALVDEQERVSLLKTTVAKYLAGVPDRRGVNLLYAGVG